MDMALTAIQIDINENLDMPPCYCLKSMITVVYKDKTVYFENRLLCPLAIYY